jgi:hypothetical protein
MSEQRKCLVLDFFHISALVPLLLQKQEAFSILLLLGYA